MGSWENPDVQRRTAAAASCFQAARVLIDVAKHQTAVLHSVRHDQERSCEFFRSRGRFNSSAGAGIWWVPGDGNTSRAGVRRRLNHHLFLPHSDLGRRDCWHGSGSHLHCWINLMMYATLGRISGIEAQYLRVKRQMRCKTVYFKPPFCFPFFATSAWKRVV